MLNFSSFVAFMRRCLCLAAASLLLATAASAYTLVMRDGRRVSIPDAFNVTATALTYEHAPGLSVTVFLSNVDIAATEQANREPAGSLRQRAVAVSPDAPQKEPAPARKTVTNDDLTVYRRARESYEATENKRRAAAGLPSLDEERQSRAAERLRQASEIEKINKENQETENYWRNRAARLREEAAALDAQIGSLSRQLGETRQADNYFLQPNAFIFASGYGYSRRPQAPRARPGFGNLNPGLQASPAVDFSPGGRESNPNFPRRPRPRFGFGYNAPIIIATGNYNADSNDTGRLRARLAELEAERAALNARWETLQEEARRAGVPPGWLR